MPHRTPGTSVGNSAAQADLKVRPTHPVQIVGRPFLGRRSYFSGGSRGAPLSGAGVRAVLSNIATIV